MKLCFSLLAMIMLATPASSADGLKFDPAELCAWQASNNGMDVGECTKLEDEAKASVATLEQAADADRKSSCVAEAKNFAGDSGFASYALYAGCLKDGAGNL
jgi:hypothetical protein